MMSKVVRLCVKKAKEFLVRFFEVGYAYTTR